MREELKVFGLDKGLRGIEIEVVDKFEGRPPRNQPGLGGWSLRYGAWTTTLKGEIASEFYLRAAGGIDGEYEIPIVLENDRIIEVYGKPFPYKEG
jgi:hypothetical protein